MKATIVKIGNSKGVRIPKKLLEEARLSGVVDLAIEDGRVIISPIKPVDGWTLLSESAFAKEWNSPEEDAAWAYLQ